MKKISVQKTIVKPSAEELDASVNALSVLGYAHFTGISVLRSGEQLLFVQTLVKEQDLEQQPVFDPTKPLPPIQEHIQSIIRKIPTEFCVNDVAKLLRIERGTHFRRPHISNEIAKLRYARLVEVIERRLGPVGSIYRVRKP